MQIQIGEMAGSPIMRDLAVGKLYDDIPPEAYHQAPGCSKSQLDLLQSRSPRHLLHRNEHPELHEPTATMQLGSALHCAILEPMRFSQRYREEPDFGTGKGSRTAMWEFRDACAAEGVVPVKAADLATISSMVYSVMDHPAAADLVDGRCEVSGWWRNDDEILCRARPDCLVNFRGVPVITDIKTTQDASLRGFNRSVERFRYHVGAAMYVDGLQTIEGFAREYCFICIETAPPYAVATFELDSNWLDIGHQLYRAGARRFAACEESGFWPGYPVELQQLAAPPWAFRALDNLDQGDLL